MILKTIFMTKLLRPRQNGNLLFLSIVIYWIFNKRERLPPSESLMFFSSDFFCIDIADFIFVSVRLTTHLAMVLRYIFD
ncbi:hypothetical protein D3C80_382150 [compost metagenome]